jgi:predicted dehydrogenase
MGFKEDNIKNLNTSWPMPSRRKKIVIIGAGGIVKQAHLPAYTKARYKILGIYDPLESKSKECANEFKIEKVYQNIDDAFAEDDVVFDIAVPPAVLLKIVKKIPPNAICQLQKPLGTSLREARQIKKIIQEKNIVACVNLQLKFSPMMLALKDAIQKQMIGEIADIEVNLSIATPWQLWPFMEQLSNIEVPLHSIHYLDWIISLLGQPKSVYCRSVKHPKFPRMKDSRSSIILDYENTRCCLSLNHTHDVQSHGMKHSHAYARVEGARGAAFVKFGLLLDYPKGEPEEIEISTEGVSWTKVDNVGSWFPDAFVNTMSSLQRYSSGEDMSLPHSVENSFITMAVVEACIESSNFGGTDVTC